MPEPNVHRRREMRFPVQPGTTIEVSHQGNVVQAQTLDISFTGILLRFETPVEVCPGEWLTLDFVQEDSDSLPLPYWGVGRVVRISGDEVALCFDIDSLVDLNWEPTCEEDPRFAEGD